MQTDMIVTIKPLWDEIEAVRIRCREFLNMHNHPARVINAITMVLSELIENAIKFGFFAKEDDVITASINIKGSMIIVEVQNPIDDSVLPHLRHLDGTIQWIRGYQDPFETYVVKLRQISRDPEQGDRNGLGLVRISFEGGSILDFYINEHNMLNVSAVYNL